MANENEVLKVGGMSEPADAEQFNYDDWTVNRFWDLSEGQIIEAKVILVHDDAAYIDTGGKSDLSIPKEELSTKPVASAREVVKVGDVIRVMVVRGGDDEKIRLSKRLVDQEQCWLDLETAFKEGATVTGTVVEAVKGGLAVNINSIRAFMPASQATLGPSKDLESLAGQAFPMKILEFDRGKRRVLVSRRVLLQEERSRNEQAFFSTISEGERRQGVVTRITDFGAFVDLGSGIEGLLHVSELSWNRVKSAREVLKEGDKLEVLITKVEPDTKRISLSLKQIQAHPWDEAVVKFQEGEIYPGTVVRLESFGAFVRLAPGIDGLAHISQISDKRIGKPDEVLKAGQEVAAKILKIDHANRKISLSLREALQDQNSQEVEQLIQKQNQEEITQNLGELLKK
ncbi:MAG: 30S ribosomal protein S1 [Firmicutes bacterium]|nr:30S ribosomal protein S1 [Bacillota bacterium]